MPRERARLRSGRLSFALTAAFLLIGTPASALAEQADLEVTGKVKRDVLTGGAGDERVVQATLTNNGPHAVNVTGNIGLDFVPLDAEILSVNPCGPTNNNSSFNPEQRNCGYGKTLAPGASIPVTAKLKVTGPDASLYVYVYSSDGCTNCQPDDPRLLEDPNPNNNTLYLDLDAPQTKITKEPDPRVNARASTLLRADTATVTYKFKSDEPGSSFECKVDKKRWKPCTSPKRVKRLDEGRHTFKVRAIDASGNVDPTPAKDQFKVVD